MEITRDVLTKLAEKNTEFVIATIVAHQGSTPRSTGTKMLVFPDGKIMGTIGGGMLEANVIKQSLIALKERRSALHSYQFTGKDAASMDMICGGEVTVMMTFIPSSAEDFMRIQQKLKNWEEKGETFLEITGFQANGNCLFGGINLTTEEEIGWVPEKDVWRAEARTTFMQLEWGYVFSEYHQPGFTVYIFGAGHVGQSVALFAKPVGFRVVVVDDRDEFANPDRFPQADEILVLPSITDVFQNRTFKASDYIVIVTRGHLQDYQVLEQALQTHAGYIGMIGSRRKNQLIFQTLREKGFPEEKIQRVHAPIGLAIGAETPEEIGISILAELIQFRANQRNR
jgi:xanthine dehydrogenase accessory factor